MSFSGSIWTVATFSLDDNLSHELKQRQNIRESLSSGKQFTENQTKPANMSIEVWLSAATATFCQNHPPNDCDCTHEGDPNHSLVDRRSQ
jgi:hypothetical protein